MFKKILIAMAITLAAPQMVWAHAHVARASPAKDAVLQQAPTTITLSLTEGVEPAFSSLTVLNASGQSITDNKAAVAPNDDKTLVLPLATALPAGVYKVRWQVLAKDGHKTNGEWSFTVKP